MVWLVMFSMVIVMGVLMVTLICLMVIVAHGMEMNARVCIASATQPQRRRKVGQKRERSWTR